MTPTNIAQYKRSATNKEVYVLTSGDASEFRRVYPTSGKRPWGRGWGNMDRDMGL